jgi:uncharacterized protein YbaP (TraB family)
MILALLFPLVGCGGGDLSPEIEDDWILDLDSVEEEWEEVEDEWEEVDGGVEEQVEEEPGIHGLISRVQHGDNVVYIFGSMHFGKPNWYPLHREVEEAMRRSDAFVFETDLSDEAMVAMAPYMLELMMLDNTTLSEFLREDAYEHLLDVIETYGVSYQSISMFTPWTVSLMLAEMAYSRVGITSTYGVDFYVMGFANTNNLPILYLNSVSHEMQLAFNIPEELQHYAALSLESLDVTVEYVEMLVSAYEAQDIQLITYLTRDSIEADGLNPLEAYMIDIILIQRSIEFAREIIRLLNETQEPTTFFVTMGIGHMIGDDYGNVFNYLLDAGYEVVPLYR